MQQSRGKGLASAAPHDAEMERAELGLRALKQLGDATAVMRGAPEYAAPDGRVQGLRALIERSAFLRH